MTTSADAGGVSVLAVRSFVVRRRRRPAGIGHLVRDRCEVEDPGAATQLAWSSAGASPDAPAGAPDGVREEWGITLTRCALERRHEAGGWRRHRLLRRHRLGWVMIAGVRRSLGEHVKDAPRRRKDAVD